MTTVTREHLAGLQYALMVAEENWPNAALTEILSDLIAQASAAPEQEPVTLPGKQNGAVGFAKGFQDGWNTCLDAVSRLGPLYTHADPSEVERLRAELEAESKGADRAAEAMLHWKKEADSLRQQLAEAQALLRELMAAWENTEGHDAMFDAFDRLRVFLSATAQPAECEHRYMYFGTQPARRCADCNKVEPAEVKS